MKALASPVLSPEGSHENSPMLQLWEPAFGWHLSPEGTPGYDTDVFSRPCGTGTAFDSPPKAEALGYSHASLRETSTREENPGNGQERAPESEWH